MVSNNEYFKILKQRFRIKGRLAKYSELLLSYFDSLAVIKDFEIYYIIYRHTPIRYIIA